MPNTCQRSSTAEKGERTTKALENRLEILLGEFHAGNQTSTRNEIVSIADELLRRKVLSRSEYKDINTYLSKSLS